MSAQIPPPPPKKPPGIGWVWAGLGVSVLLVGAYYIAATRKFT